MRKKTDPDKVRGKNLSLMKSEEINLGLTKSGENLGITKSEENSVPHEIRGKKWAL